MGSLGSGAQQFGEQSNMNGFIHLSSGTLPRRLPSPNDRRHRGPWVALRQPMVKSLKARVSLSLSLAIFPRHEAKTQIAGFAAKWPIGRGYGG
jgi:hypothetical protein